MILRLGSLIASSLLVLACGSKPPSPEASAPPPTTEPAPTPAGTLSPEACTAQGGEVRGDIGDGKIACGAGERELGRVMLGIEGSICCAPETTP